MLACLAAASARASAAAQAAREACSCAVRVRTLQLASLLQDACPVQSCSVCATASTRLFWAEGAPGTHKTSQASSNHPLLCCFDQSCIFENQALHVMSARTDFLMAVLVVHVQARLPAGCPRQTDLLTWVTRTPTSSGCCFPACTIAAVRIKKCINRTQMCPFRLL
jgi:hypothetical protein